MDVNVRGGGQESGIGFGRCCVQVDHKRRWSSTSRFGCCSGFAPRFARRILPNSFNSTTLSLSLFFVLAATRRSPPLARNHNGVLVIVLT